MGIIYRKEMKTMAGDDIYKATVETDESDISLEGTTTMHKETKPSSLLGKARGIITIEPVCFLFMFALGIHLPASDSLTYRKTCLNMFNDSSICNHLNNVSFVSQEDMVQAKSSHWLLLQDFCFQIPAIIMSIFNGYISDKYCRKVAMALPFIGEILKAIVYIACTLYIDSSAGMILIGKGVSGVFGGWMTMFLSTFSCLALMTTEKSRTSRMAVAGGLASLGFSVAFGISGLLLDNTSYIFCFGLEIVLFIMAIIYIITWIEVPGRNSEKIDVTSDDKGKITSPLTVLKETIHVITKKRPNNGRKRIIITFIIVFTATLAYHAMYSLIYLFLKRRPFYFTQSLFGYLVGTFKGITTLTLIFIVPLLKHKFKMSDTSLILWSLLSSTVMQLFLSISKHWWMIVIGVFIGFLSEARGTGCNALLSVLVTSDEVGRAYAASGSLTTLASMIGTALYNSVYAEILEFWPGFVFALGCVISLIPLGLTAYLSSDLERLQIEDTDSIEASKQQQKDRQELLEPMISVSSDSSTEVFVRRPKPKCPVMQGSYAVLESVI